MTRRSIKIEGFNHGPQPIPAASRVGDIVMTGGIYGMDPETESIPDGLEEQARLMFVQLGRILSAAGAGLGDIVKMTFYLKSHDARAAVNPEWLTAFPDPLSRPARHTLINDHLPGHVLLQCEAMAVIVHD
jgi:enamine deaminase RidA (YjgF/YER057c/UK114 family)